MTPTKPTFLYIFSGLPGVGKSTLAQGLAAQLGCAYLRIDSVEQSLRDLCSLSVEGEGYEFSYRIAADNLMIGVSVVADSCNPIEFTRNQWEDVARDNGAIPINIEVCCTNKAEHQNRVQTRVSTVPGLNLPTWPEVEDRLYHAWTKERVIVDTGGRTVKESLDLLFSLLNPQMTEAGYQL